MSKSIDTLLERYEIRYAEYLESVLQREAEEVKKLLVEDLITGFAFKRVRWDDES